MAKTTKTDESANLALARETARAFDHWSVEIAEDPYPAYASLREHCPVAHSEMYGGFWVLSRYKDVLAALRKPSMFSSSVILIPPQDSATMVKVPPLDQDPPAHTRYRQLLLPYFSMGRAKKLEPFTRAVARHHAASVAAQGTADVVGSFAFPVPMLVLCEILGIDPTDQQMFGNWITKIVEQGATDPEGAVVANKEIRDYLRVLLGARRSEPRDDLLSFLLHAELGDAPLSDDERLGIAALLLIAGIDTTANMIAAALWHLGQDLETQESLRSDPARLQLAVEEFLRFFAPVSISRIAACPTEVNGAAISARDMVLLSLPSANRDAETFAEPEAVVTDRAPNPHIAFGSGVHRCLGAHIARMEMAVCLEEFLTAVPTFHLSQAPPTTWKQGPIRGPNSVTLVVTNDGRKP